MNVKEATDIVTIDIALQELVRTGQVYRDEYGVYHYVDLGRIAREDLN